MKLSNLSTFNVFKIIIALYFIIVSITFSNVIIPTNKLTSLYFASAYSLSNDQRHLSYPITSTSASASTIEQQIPQHIQNEWISKRDNIKIIFSSDPSKIITNKDINLRFDVLNLATGQYVKDFDAKVTMISNNENMFKFQSLSNDKGYLVINHKFSDPGTSQIFFRIDKPSEFFSTATAFSIVTMPNENSMINALPISIAFTAIALIVIIVIRKKLKEDERLVVSKKKT